MNAEAMEAFGRALLTYFEGDAAAELMIRRDDGQVTPLPVRFFFREPSEFTPIERAALEWCTGRVLDVGAGTGLHSVLLQEKGLAVTAIDISPHAVKILKHRGVYDVRCEDVFDFRGGPFDTLLMLGHGVGMVESISGLDRFLVHAQSLVAAAGQILLDSLDVRCTNDPTHLAYQEANRRVGRYVGEIGMQFGFQGFDSAPFRWLHVDPETLRRHAEAVGWRCDVVRQEPSGDHLSRLTKEKPA